MTKYKYYFRKPKSEIVKDILLGLAVSGAIAIAATSPYFSANLIKGFKNWKKYKKYEKEESKKIYNTFYLLRKEGCILIREENNQIYISLTERGKKKANWLQIDCLKIKKPKVWDKKWRLIIFDIAELKRIYRESFRGKLKELGFYSLQKSIWVYPFDCRDEIGLLKDFFGLSDKELRLIVSEDIGDDKLIKDFFKLALFRAASCAVTK